MPTRAKMVSTTTGEGGSYTGLSLGKEVLESLGIDNPEIGREFEMVIKAKVESKHESEDSKDVYLEVTEIGLLDDDSDNDPSTDRIKKLYRIEGQFEDQ